LHSGELKRGVPLFSRGFGDIRARSVPGFFR
jgi:hypothetical protein